MSQARGRAEGVQALLPPRLGDAGGLGPGGAPLLVPARGCRVAGRRHRARRVQAFLPSEGAGTEGSERGRGKGPLLRRCRRFQERQKVPPPPAVPQDVNQTSIMEALANIPDPNYNNWYGDNFYL
ncbi:uncharacterized protein LOC144366039 isoform X2 [Ictidomys tridecemlineatus]